jgi:hypothetical protein
MNDRQRLEAIIAVVCKYLPPDGISIEKAMNEIISLVDPLPPQHTEQEPVAWMYQEYRDDDQFGWRDEIQFVQPPNDPNYFRNIVPVYTHPPQREWVWLKDEEIWSLITRIGSENSDVNPLTILADVRAVEFRIHMKNSDVKQEPQRTWVGLTDEEIKEFDTWHDNREEEVGWCNPSEIVAYIEAKLKERNT